MLNKPCYILYNTRWGYVLQPRKFTSIKQALADTATTGMAYRLYDTAGKFIKQGWER